MDDTAIVKLHRKARFWVAGLDLALLTICFWGALAIVEETWRPSLLREYPSLLVLIPALAIPLFAQFGLYRTLLLYVSAHTLAAITLAMGMHTALTGALATFTPVEIVPASLVVGFLGGVLGVGGSRVLLRSAMHWLLRDRRGSRRAIIYGAGSAGAELVDALRGNQEYLPVAFVDDKKRLEGQDIRGLKVYPTARLKHLIRRYSVDEVLLAIPSASHARRRSIMESLGAYRVHVKTVPPLSEILSGKSPVNAIREPDVTDILGRDPVEPDEAMLEMAVADKVVMVSGAGGSIGSELCRQILDRKPGHLVLFERSEYALYQTERELRETTCLADELAGIRVTPILGSVTDYARVRSVLETFGVQTVYHAAAYKHVPLVEYNPLEGINNNVFGTWHAARAAIDAAVETFILISTDKAVRPTNVMGATKRLAEQVVQGLADQDGVGTVFSVVRFGNVLGSSGSVVPLFREQIARGGPVTLTHHDITRYFMTIPEASQLVIQAGAMAKGVGVFILDMGEPVRIMDMARRMIVLSGRTVRDESNPAGDIPIEITALRPGEKLHEELLIGDDVVPTMHPRILRSRESGMPWDRLSDILQRLQTVCACGDCEGVRALLREAVSEYAPNGEIEDLVWRASCDAKLPDMLPGKVVG